MYDSGIVSTVRSAEPKPVDNFEQFFQENADRAKLIYGGKKDEDKVKVLAPNVRVNEADLSVTKNLTKTDCLLVTEELLMRGIDYRAKSDGIALLIAKELSSDRASN